jgi:hypothetical protein
MLKIKIGGGASGPAEMGSDDKLKALDYLESMLDEARAKAMGEDTTEEATPEGEMTEEQERQILER